MIVVVVKETVMCCPDGKGKAGLNFRVFNAELSPISRIQDDVPLTEKLACHITVDGSSRDCINQKPIGGKSLSLKTVFSLSGLALAIILHCRSIPQISY